MEKSKLDHYPRVEPFVLWCRAHNLPMPDAEVTFAKPRRFRFDWCWPAWQIALEVDGGAWTGGRHTRGAGFIRDLEKMNLAALNGYRVLRVTPQQLMTQETLVLLQQVLR